MIWLIPAEIGWGSTTSSVSFLCVSIIVESSIKCIQMQSINQSEVHGRNRTRDFALGNTGIVEEQNAGAASYHFVAEEPSSSWRQPWSVDWAGNNCWVPSWSRLTSGRQALLSLAKPCQAAQSGRNMQTSLALARKGLESSFLQAHASGSSKVIMAMCTYLSGRGSSR